MRERERQTGCYHWRDRDQTGGSPSPVARCVGPGLPAKTAPPAATNHLITDQVTLPVRLTIFSITSTVLSARD